MPSFQHWTIEQQYPALQLPDTWNNLDDFVKWYLSSGKPITIPWNAEVIRTDDATAITLFRRKQYQVELYLIHPGFVIPVHSHPGMEVTTMLLGGGGAGGAGGAAHPVFDTGINIGRCNPTADGHTHGGGDSNHTGFALLAFEHWMRNIPPTSAALQWAGPTAGPVHDALLAARTQ